MTDRPGSLLARLPGYVRAILAAGTGRVPPRQGYPDLLATPADLPITLRLLVEQTSLPQAEVRTIFFVPAQTFLQLWRGPRYVPEQALLFTSQGVLHVQAPVAPDRPPRPLISTPSISCMLA